jgi:predicted  nucleic acid-binding Zn-ribbon protein
MSSFQDDLEKLEKKSEQAKMDKVKYSERLEQLQKQEEDIKKEFEKLNIKPEDTEAWVRQEEKLIAEEIIKAKEVLCI